MRVTIGLVPHQSCIYYQLCTMVLRGGELSEIRQVILITYSPKLRASGHHARAEAPYLPRSLRKTQHPMGKVGSDPWGSGEFLYYVVLVPIFLLFWKCNDFHVHLFPVGTLALWYSGIGSRFFVRRQ